jgi:hypothetical protein
MTCARSEREEVLRDADPRGPQGVDLGEERVRIHHDAGADHAHPAADDPGGRRCRAKWRSPNLTVAGVVPAVVAGDDVESVGEKVDDLPFPSSPH